MKLRKSATCAQDAKPVGCSGELRVVWLPQRMLACSSDPSFFSKAASVNSGMDHVSITTASTGSHVSGAPESSLVTVKHVPQASFKPATEPYLVCRAATATASKARSVVV